MPTSQHDLETRNRYIQEAKDAPFLDAVFLILYYNQEVKRWGPPPKLPDIEPAEVFSELDEELFRAALARARRLLSQNSAVGRAFFRYPGATHSYKEELAIFRQSNPGFSERCYSLAVEAGIRDMR